MRIAEIPTLVRGTKTTRPVKPGDAVWCTTRDGRLYLATYVGTSSIEPDGTFVIYVRSLPGGGAYSVN